MVVVSQSNWAARFRGAFVCPALFGDANVRLLPQPSALKVLVAQRTGLQILAFRFCGIALFNQLHELSKTFR